MTKGKDTLVLAVSYSGETEETLAGYGQAVAVGSRVTALSSGGQLAALARADRVPHVTIPGHVPAPRAALGFLVGAAVGVLEAVGLLPDVDTELGGASAALEALSSELAPDRPAEGNRAKSLAEWLQDRKSTRLNSSHGSISYAVFCLKKKKKNFSILVFYKKKKKQKNI